MNPKYKQKVITQFFRNASTQRPHTLLQWEKEEDIIPNLLQERQVKPTFPSLDMNVFSKSFPTIPAEQRTNSRISEAQKEEIF